MVQLIDIPTGEVIATNVSPEEYMERFAAEHYEWVRGYVIQMSPVSLRHDDLTDYFRKLLDAYLTLNPIGRVIGQPFVMQVDVTESRREPALQIILNDNVGELTPTAMVGPADICIEVVSLESSTRDYGEKFTEYERGGVREYWIVDPLRQECRFHRLTDEGTYRQILPEDDVYTTSLLPRLQVQLPLLWQETLPNYFEIGRAVQQMVAED
jgi:Uma2 family endonuclease